MSAHLARPHSLAHIAPHLAMALRLAWRRFQRAYALALRAETSRRTLHRLDARMLSDIGITRAQAVSEANRKRWRHG